MSLSSPRSQELERVTKKDRDPLRDDIQRLVDTMTEICRILEEEEPELAPPRRVARGSTNS